ncbi:CACNA1D [Symbiodinium sp. CCMP2456]|nr:CACNA1D [Symbiodinium sp. CCMP2456]
MERGSKTSQKSRDTGSTSDASEDSLDTFERAQRQGILSREEIANAQVIDPELFTKGSFFCSLSALLAIVGLIEMGLETDYRCNTGRCVGDEPVWDLLNLIFTILPLAENGLRLWEAKPRRFIMGDKTKVKFKLDWANCTDALLVLLRILDVWVLSPLGIDSGLRMATGFRILRIGPAVKHWQATKELRELWIVIGAVSETFKTLIWVGVMLIFVIWTFGILITMSLIDRRGEEFNFTASAWTFADYWGSVPRSAYSLFQVATRDSWISAMVAPLIETEPLLLIIFGFYFCIGSLALMNAIIGVVVECTLSAARASTEKEDEDKKRADTLVMDSLRRIFHEGDTDGSGELDIEECNRCMDRISGFCRVGPSLEVRDRLKMLRMPFSVRGLVSVALVLTADGERDFEPDHGPVEDLDLLFTLLDTESKGTARNRLKPCQFGLWESCLEDPKVNTDMFFRGCAKLRTDSGPGTRHCDFDEWSRGPAMACDLHQLSIDLKHNLAQERCDHNSERIRQVNETLAIVLDHVDDASGQVPLMANAGSSESLAVHVPTDMSRHAEMDISIMKSDVDFKDPVLAARQVRPKTSKSDIIRGRWLIPVAHNEQSMWLDLDRQAKLNEAKGDLGSAKIHALTPHVPQVKVKEPAFRDSIDQPPPPPMPARVQPLKDVKLSQVEQDRARLNNQIAKALRKLHRFE